MSDTLSFVEIDGQHVELLPGRTVMSAVGPLSNVLGATADGGGAGSEGDAISQSGDAQNVQKPEGGAGGNAVSGVLNGLLGSLTN